MPDNDDNNGMRVRRRRHGFGKKDKGWQNAAQRRLNRNRQEGGSRGRRRRITEDSPAFNSLTMGNRVTGAGPNRSRRQVGVPGPAMTRDNTNWFYGKGQSQASGRTISPNRRRGGRYS